MFTDRFIKLPIRIYDVDQGKVSGKELHECASIKIKIRIDPEQIEDYYPCIAAGEAFNKENITTVRVIMRSGEYWSVPLEITVFESLLNGIKDPAHE